MAMAMIDDCHSLSLKAKLKSSICCFPSQPPPLQLQNDSLDDGSRRPRSPYSWLKSTAHDFEIKEKCWGLIGRRGKNPRRRHHSADFKYDAASYSLNFEDDNLSKEDELPLNNFTARLPATPDRFTTGRR